MSVVSYQASMDAFFKQEGMSIIGVPTENQIRAYAVMAPLGLYAMARVKEGKPEAPQSLKHRVSILLTGIQCVHMLFRNAYAGQDTSAGEIGQLKEAVIQNVCSNLMDTDLDNPSDESLGAMSTAAILYRDISASRPELLRAVDDAWERMFLVRNMENANAILTCMTSFIRYQTDPETA